MANLHPISIAQLLTDARRFVAGARRLLVLLALTAPLWCSAGYSPGPGWPEVDTNVFQARTWPQLTERISHWMLTSGVVIKNYRDTGSMDPVLSGGRELLALQKYTPALALHVGEMVEFNRGDLPSVLHYIAAISKDGQYVLLSGVNCRQSDGWFHRSRISAVLREIIAPPPGMPANPTGTLALYFKPQAGRPRG